MSKFIVFTNDSEVIITTPGKRKETIKEYFTLGGRDIDEYDEQVLDESAVHINITTFVRGKVAAHQVERALIRELKPKLNTDVR
jgi:hypothetical protein